MDGPTALYCIGPPPSPLDTELYGSRGKLRTYDLQLEHPHRHTAEHPVITKHHQL